MATTVKEQLEINGIPLGPELSKEQAKAIYALGEEAVVFVLLAQAQMAADEDIVISSKLVEDTAKHPITFDLANNGTTAKARNLPCC